MKNRLAFIFASLLALVLFAPLAAPPSARGQATTPAPRPAGLEIVSAFWKVAKQPDADVTASARRQVKNDQLDIKVGAAAFGLPTPAGGVTGTLVITYRINGGNPQTKTVRGGGTPLQLSAPKPPAIANAGSATRPAADLPTIVVVPSTAPDTRVMPDNTEELAAIVTLLGSDDPKDEQPPAAAHVGVAGSREMGRQPELRCQ